MSVADSNASVIHSSDMIHLSINEEAQTPSIHHEYRNVRCIIRIYLNLLEMKAASEYFCGESRFQLRHSSFEDQSVGWPGMRLGV